MCSNTLDPKGSPSKACPLALCMGGVDPSSGAGIFRDLLTLAALGVDGMAVSTAETIQNGAACSEIHPPAVDPLRRVAFLRAHLSAPWGIKLGLCAMPLHQWDPLLELLETSNPQCKIWDPVLAPTAGVALHKPATLEAMAVKVLKSGQWVVSPNRVEAQTLLGTQEDDVAKLARPWIEMGAKAVWIKGGHCEGKEIEDFWVETGQIHSLGRFQRLVGDRRGTGCTLASAWLAFRLRGEAERQAAKSAVGWIRDLWGHAWSPGDYGRAAFRVGTPC